MNNNSTSGVSSLCKAIGITIISLGSIAGLIVLITFCNQGSWMVGWGFLWGAVIIFASAIFMALFLALGAIIDNLIIANNKYDVMNKKLQRLNIGKAASVQTANNENVKEEFDDDSLPSL